MNDDILSYVKSKIKYVCGDFARKKNYDLNDKLLHIVCGDEDYAAVLMQIELDYPGLYDVIGDKYIFGATIKNLVDEIKNY